MGNGGVGAEEVGSCGVGKLGLRSWEVVELWSWGAGKLWRWEVEELGTLGLKSR